MSIPYAAVTLGQSKMTTLFPDAHDLAFALDMLNETDIAGTIDPEDEVITTLIRPISEALNANANKRGMTYELPLDAARKLLPLISEEMADFAERMTFPLADHAMKNEPMVKTDKNRFGATVALSQLFGILGVAVRNDTTVTFGITAN